MLAARSNMTRDRRTDNARYYSENRVAMLAKAAARQHRICDAVRQIKLDAGCVRCGYKKCASSLQFHHHQGDKERGIGRMVSRGFSLAAVLKEVAKCVILCANCHFELHEQEDWRP